MDHATEADRQEKKSGAPRRARRAPALFYAAFCALFSSVAVLGLFFGFFIGHAPLGVILAGGEPILEGSLLGVMVEVLRGSISAPPAGGGLAGGLSLALYLSVFLLMISVAASLALTVLSFLRPSSARKLCLVNGSLVTLAYGLASLLSLLCGALSAEMFGWQMLDLPTALTAALSLLFLFAYAVFLRRGRGALGCVICLLTLTGIFTFVYPETALLGHLSAAFSRESELHAAVRAFCILTFAAFAANLVLSVLRLGAKGSFLPDAIRFALWLFAAFGLLIAELAAGTSVADFFMEQPLPAILLIVSPLAGLMMSAFGASLSAERKRPRAEEPGPAVRPAG